MALLRAVLGLFLVIIILVAGAVYYGNQRIVDANRTQCHQRSIAVAADTNNLRADITSLQGDISVLQLGRAPYAERSIGLKRTDIAAKERDIHVYAQLIDRADIPKLDNSADRAVVQHHNYTCFKAFPSAFS